MLSIQSLPGPSCPCTKSQGLTHNDSDSHQLPFQEAEHSDIQKPNFSIRDYVLRSRNKCITKNWPFPPKLLQCCLKHSISDILPPIEPPNLVKTHLSREEAGFEQHGVIQEEDPTLSPHLDPFKNAYVDLIDKESDNVKCDPTLSSKKVVPSLLNCKQDKLKSVFEASSQLDVTEDPPLPENHETLYEHVGRKCRLVPNLSVISETNQAEGILPILDSMASKICPVCKIFSSSSNTTLNAHIDQCLSTESNNAEAIAIPFKLKVRPKKKRLMVDVYATAPHCTLEDLDRRNGTNWVSEMNTLATNCNSETILSSHNNEVGKEMKRPKLCPEDIRDDGNEEKVYVDSNGIKLRILSKFSDGKHAKNTKASKKLPTIKTKLLQPRLLNDEQMDPKSGNLTFSDLQILDEQHSDNTDKHLEKEASECQLTDGCRHVKIQAAQNIDGHVDKHLEQEKPECQVTDECHKVKINRFETLTKWVCSKRSDLHKKLKKNSNKSSATIEVGTQNARQEKITELPVEKKHLRIFSKSSKILTSSLKTKKMDLLCKPAEKLVAEEDPGPVLFSSHWKSEDCSSHSLLLKLSRSTGKFVSSPRSRREEIYNNTILQPDETYKHSLDAKKNNVLKQNMSIGIASSSSRAKVVTAHTLMRKSRKHRLLSNNAKVPPFDIVHRVRGCTDDSLERRRGKALWIVQSDASGSDMSPSLSISKDQESSVAEVVMKGDVIVSDDDLPQHSINDAVLDTADVSNSEKLKHATISGLNQFPSIGRHAPLHEMEAQMEVEAPRLLPQQGMEHNDVSENQIDAQGVEIDGNRHIRGDFMVVEGTINHTGTLITQGIVNKETSHEKSSVTSTVVSCMRRGSGSSRSTSSASFLCPPEDTIWNAAAQHSNLPGELRENQDSSVLRNLKLPPLECVERSKETVIKKMCQESLESPVSKNHEQLPNDQPCCCFKRESTSSDPQALRPNAISVTPLRPSMYSPFYYGYGTSNDIVGIPTFGLPVASFVKPSGDSVRAATFCDRSSPSPSPRTQTMLRLMGKNLMVSSDAQAVNLPFNTSDNASNVRCFPSDTFFGQLCSIPGHNMPVGSASGHLYSYFNARPVERANLDHMPAQYTGAAAPHQVRETVSIDNCPEHRIASTSCSLSPIPAFAIADALHARPSSCFTSHQFQSTDFLSASSSSFPISYPRGANAIPELVVRGSTQEAFPPPHPGFPFSASSTGHAQQHFYYSPTL